MTWEDQGLWFTLILNAAALAVLIPLAYFLHTTKILSIARIYRPNHTIEPEKPPQSTSAFEDRNPNSKEDDKHHKREHDDNERRDEEDHPAIPAADRDSRTHTEAAIPEEKVFNPHDENAVGIREVGAPPQHYDSISERNNEEGVPKAEGKGHQLKTGKLLPRKSSLFSMPPIRRLLSVGEEPWEGDEDDQPLRRDPHADLFLLFVKLCLVLFFIGTALSTVWLAIACGLDNYIEYLALQNDPAECRGSSLGDCNDNPLCGWDGVSCQPAPRRGLYDLSLQNATPKSSRLWAVGILALLFSIICAYAMYRALRSITAYHRRVLKRQLKCAIGYRTVLVKGLDLPPKHVLDQNIKTQEMTIYRAGPKGTLDINEEKISVGIAPDTIPGYPGSDVELFTREFLSAGSYFDDANDKVALGGVAGGLKVARDIPVAGSVGGQKKTVNDLALFQGRDPATGVTNKIEEVVMEREVHKKFYKCLEKYEEAKTALKDAIADERRYHEDLKMQRTAAARLLAKGSVKNKSGETVAYEKETDLPPLMGRIIPSSICLTKVPVVEYRKKDLLMKGEELNEAILEGRSKPFTGSVFVIFKDALSAFEFSNLFHQRYGGVCSGLSARVAGPHDKVELTNLTRSKYILAIILVLMSFAFFILVFFWSVPVGFLGSLDSLASIPGIGPAFQTFIDKVPTTIVGILTAYLPVIVLAIFNIILPLLIRFFVVSGGTLTELDTDHGVLLQMYLFLVLTGVVFQAALQGGLAQLGNIISDPSQDVIFAFVTAVISPKGGYWYAKILSAGCLSMWINALLIGPFIVMFLLAKRANTQRKYNAIFSRQKQDWPLRYAFTLVITTIGFFFHVTVPLLGIFVGIFFVNQYVVYRGLLLDGWAPDQPPDQMVSNFRLSSCTFRIMAWCYLIATVGAAIVVGLKEHVGGLVFCIIAVIVSLAILIATYYYSHQWHPTLKNVEAALAAEGSENAQQLRKEQTGRRSDSEPITPGTAISIPEEAKDKTIVPTSDDTDLEDEDKSPLAKAVKDLKPYHSKHHVVTEAINMDDTIKDAEDKHYGVQMVWHSQDQRDKMEEEHNKENEKEGKKLAKDIAAGKHKPSE